MMTFDAFDLDSQNDDCILDELNSIDPDLCLYNEFASQMNSSYYSQESFNELVQSSSFSETSFAIFHSNIQSLHANKQDLLSTLSNFKFTFPIICLTETWLNDINKQHLHLPNYQHEFRYRTKKSGGGVSIFIRNNLSFSTRDDLSTMEDCFESVFAEIDHREISADRNIVIGCIYRPPKTSINDFNKSLNRILNSLSTENKHCYLCGDFNVDLLKADSHLPTASFLEHLFSHSLFPSINKPTRISVTSATIIDNIFFDPIHTRPATSGILTCAVSDHLPVFTLTRFQMNNLRNNEYITTRIFNDRNKAKFKNMLNSCRWDGCLHESNCQNAFTAFYDQYKQCFERCFPLTKLRVGYRNRKSWLTEGLRSSIKRKNALYRIFMRTRNAIDKKRYSEYKRQLRSLLRQAERNHYKHLFNMHRSNLRKSWGVIKEVLNRKRCNPSDRQMTLSVDGEQVSDPSSVCQVFNEFFVSIGPSLADAVPPVNVDPCSFIRFHSNSSLFLKPTDTTEILNILKDLRNSAPGPDGIPALIVKENAETIVPMLAHIINLSFVQGTFPQELKIAKVSPLYKSGDAKKTNNYRPISLLSVFSKILEKCMSSRLMDHMTKNNILYKYQFGFRPKHSTSMALHLLVDKITESLNKKESFVGVALDFRKAFDTVDFSILLQKLYRYGIRGNSLLWFDSYLNQRKQYVSFSNVNSPLLSVQCGVPQGSVLGPLLFLLYINDLPNSTDLLPIIFADDTNVFCRGKDLESCVNQINSQLTGLVHWIRANKLSLNVEKSQFIAFTNRKRIPDESDIVLDGRSVARVSVFKFLGVHIDDRLTWKHHINHLRGKISRSIGVLNAARPLLDRTVLLNLYYTFVYPLFTYCIDVWGHCSSQSFHSLFKLQKRAVRVITSSKKFSHTAPLFQSLNILPLSELYIFSVAIFMFKFHHRLLPTSLDDLFHQNATVHSVSTRQQYLLHVQLIHSEISKKSIRIRGVKLWNKILTDRHLNVYVSQSVFKSTFLNLLFEKPNHFNMLM